MKTLNRLGIDHISTEYKINRESNTIIRQVKPKCTEVAPLCMLYVRVVSAEVINCCIAQGFGELDVEHKADYFLSLWCCRSSYLRSPPTFAAVVVSAEASWQCVIAAAPAHDVGFVGLEVPAFELNASTLQVRGSFIATPILALWIVDTTERVRTLGYAGRTLAIVLHQASFVSLRRIQDKPKLVTSGAIPLRTRGAVRCNACDW